MSFLIKQFGLFSNQILSPELGSDTPNPIKMESPDTVIALRISIISNEFDSVRTLNILMRTLIHYAIDAVNPYVVHLLVDAGVIVWTRDLYEILDKADDVRLDNEPPLHGFVEYSDACGNILDEVIPQVDICDFGFRCQKQSPLDFIMCTNVPLSFINKIINATMVKNQQEIDAAIHLLDRNGMKVVVR